jgi:hypothetical protein
MTAGSRVNRQNSALFAADEGWLDQSGSDSVLMSRLFGGKTLSQSDPTDHALAAIASILENPETHREPETTAIEESTVAPEPSIVPEPSMAPEQIEADGYSKVGPGPIAAIRFRWTVRRDDHGEYYVDETIGENSAPITHGPLTGDAAIQLVDSRESEALQRFETLRSQMTGRGAVANLVRKDSGEM